MSHKTFTLTTSSADYRVTTGNRTLALPPSDIPVEFEVWPDVEKRLICIAVIYQSGMGEATNFVRMDRVDCETGVHSNRLFGLRIHLNELAEPHLHQVAQELQKALEKALRMLRDRTPAEGARMNYRIVEEGLVRNPDEASVEAMPWMQFALDRLRGGPASGSEKR